MRVMRLAPALAACLALACSERDAAWLGRRGAATAAAGWSNAGVMNAARQCGTATLLPSGQVLFAGGLLADASAELYDPEADTFRATGSMLTGRAYHAASVLPDGRVLVAGGIGPGGTDLASTELYDPVTERWEAGNPMIRARPHLTATALWSGQVLVAGGQDAERYDPATATWALTGPTVHDTGSTSVTVLPSGLVLAAGGTGAGAAADLYDPATDAWRATGSMAGGRYSHTATLLASGEVLVAGGQDSQTGKTLQTAELFDPSTETWRSTADTQLSWIEASATLLPSGKVLVTAGQSSELYDPTSGTWRSAGPAAARHDSGTATLLPSGKVLLAGGTGIVAELFDPVDGAWRTSLPQLTARAGATATLLPGGKVLLAGGVNGSTPLASAELYDPAAGAWMPTGSMGHARAGHTATPLPGGQVLVAGGAGLTGRTATTEIYDPRSGTWSDTGPMALARSGHTATRLPDGRILVAGGVGAGTLASAELYRPSTGTWRTASAMSVTRAGHTATLLPDGRVLVAGGKAAAQFRSSAELYDPATGAWSSAGAMFSARANHTATVIRRGVVLLAGGDGPSGPLPDAEQFQPASGTWRAESPMGWPRSRHTAVVLASGKLLVSGGMGSGGALAAAEVYDGATGTWTAVASQGTARADAAATLLPDGEVLVTGGGDSATLAVTERYEDTGANDAWRPLVTALPPGNLGQVLTLAGQRFRGISEGSNGAVSGNSAANVPVVRLVPAEGGAGLEAAALSFSSTSLSVRLPAVPDGDYLLTVTVNGITGGGGTPVDGAPFAPVLTEPAPSVSSLTPRISGRAEGGTAVSVRLDQAVLGIATADEDGAWSLTPASPLSEGTHEAAAVASDASGHSSTGPSLVFVVDVTAPDAPAIAAPAAAIDTSQALIAGSGEAGSTVTIWLDGTLAGTAVVDGSRAWSLQSAFLADGPHVALASATDQAGNTGAASAPWPFAVDTAAPNTPTVIAPADGASLATARPAISGTAEIDSTVVATLDGSVTATVPADHTGAWSFTPALALDEGRHSLSVKARDLAGNESPAPALGAFTVDTVAPAPPSLATPAEGAVVSARTPVISGAAEANSTVTVSVDGTEIGSTQASQTGAWSMTSPSLADGMHAALARATDAAGNSSKSPEATTFTVDSAAPGAPTIVAPVDGALLTTATPSISGWAEEGSAVGVAVDAIPIGSPVAGPTGSWTITSPGLTEGPHTITARAADGAGNAGATSSISVTVDTVAPPAPVLVSPQAEELVRTPAPRLLGTAEPGSTVWVTLDGELAGTAQVDESDEWSFTPEVELADGLHAVALQASDAAGNAGPTSVPRSFTVQRSRGYYGGCSAAPPGAFGAWLLLLAWRRRRSAPRR